MVDYSSAYASKGGEAYFYHFGPITRTVDDDVEECQNLAGKIEKDDGSWADDALIELGCCPTILKPFCNVNSWTISNAFQTCHS